ncbi:MAG: HNH endonuclease [Bacteroidota bacterium]
MRPIAHVDWNAFAQYLVRWGVRIQPLQHADELIRYRLGEVEHVVALGPGETLRISEESSQHLVNFYNRRPPFERERHLPQRETLVAALLERDGSDCCLCGEPLGEDVTIEHWLAQSHGGPDALANLGLAHAICNTIAGAMSVAEKVRLRDQLHVEARLKLTRRQYTDPDTWRDIEARRQRVRERARQSAAAADAEANKASGKASSAGASETSQEQKRWAR